MNLFVKQFEIRKKVLVMQEYFGNKISKADSNTEPFIGKREKVMRTVRIRTGAHFQSSRFMSNVTFPSEIGATLWAYR